MIWIVGVSGYEEEGIVTNIMKAGVHRSQSLNGQWVTGEGNQGLQVLSLTRRR